MEKPTTRYRAITCLLLSVLTFCHAQPADVEDAYTKRVDQCGLRVAQMQHILGGIETEQNFWPWAVSVRSQGRHICSGVLITDRHVLTAAHCFFDSVGDRKVRKNLTKMEVIAGEHDVLHHDPNEQLIKMRSLTLHPRYNTDERATDYNYDLAVVRLQGPVTNANVSRPICLPDATESAPSGRRCVTFGWGLTEAATLVIVGNVESDVLKQAVIPVISEEQCKQDWPDVSMESNFCGGRIAKYGGNAERPIGPCRGDSGSPLICPTNDGVWKVYGVLSWGAMLCMRKYAVFSDVSEFSDWIRSVVQATHGVVPPPIDFRTGASSRNTTVASCDTSQFEALSRTSIVGEVIRTVDKVLPLVCARLCCFTPGCGSIRYVRNLSGKCTLLKQRICDVNQSSQVTYSTPEPLLYMGKPCR